MNRIPPTLLYLTIYNPTLRPTDPIDGDNEDAEEQAHILFYTSKERAVSRDRMLRQIGLAKALINFAESFSMNDTCDNVHSQSKRMIMVSPEPDFWIHAGVEVAKTPRNVDSKYKTKTKGKLIEKGKGNESSPLYDYEDGSVHDNALRACILQGYEKFKLTHGSFTSILATLGQQALELQLERFWTVWGWSWNLEEKMSFGEQFGPLLHPLFSSLVPLIDKFSERLSELTPVVLSRQHIIPSGRYTEGRYPTVLATHLSSMIPPAIEPSRSSDMLDTLASSVDTIRDKRSLDVNVKGTSSNSHTNDGGTFLGIPAMNMNMDIKKWNWPGYLTFGKGDKAIPSYEKSSNSLSGKDKEVPPSIFPEEQEESRLQVEVNTSDLEDAISSNSVSTTSGTRNQSDTAGMKDTSTSTEAIQKNASEIPFSTTNPNDITTVNLFSLPTPDPEEDLPPSPPSPPPLPEFSLTRLNLAPPHDPTNTRKTTIYYLIQRDRFMLALVDMHDCANKRAEAEDTDLKTAAEQVTQLFDDLESTIYDPSLGSTPDSLPSATKILQTPDRYLMSTAHYTHASPGFASTSSHLFNAKAILELDPEITEVFSRGQNPQHWHIAKRGLSNSQITDIDNIGSEEAVFMEVFRKETSLTDVDNVLVGVVKKSGLLDSS
ncbi:hypothetical protein CVT25_009760 [Psilocybe cyanescens]|uniref:CCZ1/INTU/HSP4 first Longin domain-containing protein n=1 Tax=Psilocybe cyanescens TaxID=93625 RepID=A0A409VU82_PSICY|nr:hypothetical protein CVT25_009760 [Psilocybe cyanescens]